MKSKVIVLILIMFAFFTCKPNSNNNEYINVSNINNTKAFSGYVKSRQITKLSFRTDGKISFMPYKKGDYFKKGEVLARLDSTFYKIKKEEFNFEDEFNYNVIIAPFDGYIEEIYKPLNSYTKKEQIVLALSPTDKTEAEILVQPEYINKINLRENGILEYKNTNYEVKISNIVKSDDNYLVELKMDNLYKELREGTNIKVLLNLAQ